MSLGRGEPSVKVEGAVGVWLRTATPLRRVEESLVDIFTVKKRREVANRRRDNTEASYKRREQVFIYFPTGVLSQRRGPD